jgi:hypothetical protein
VFGSFGSLAVPLHIDVINQFVWLPILSVLVLICLSTAFFLETGWRRQVSLVVAAAVWILLPVAPVYPIFGVAQDLQGSRFLYLSTIGWAGLVTVVAAGHGGRRLWSQTLATAAVVGLIVIGLFGTVHHLRPWQDAARLRDRVEASALRAGMDSCRTIRMSNVPDSVRGAYVFRVGLTEAFARDLKLKMTLVNDNPDCSFRWSDTDLTFVQSRAD